MECIILDFEGHSQMNNRFFKKEKIILIEEPIFLKQVQNEVEQNRQFDEISSLKSFK